MSTSHVSVLPDSAGRWIVAGAGKSQVFTSKLDALAEAYKRTRSGKVIVATASGQIIRPAKAKTSIAPSAIRQAVWAVAMSARAKQ